MSLHISAAADYALRALLILATENPGTPVKAQAIADREQIPLRYLWTILLQLRNAGILSSLRGNDGGYWLIREPSNLTVADVIQAVDGPLLQQWPNSQSNSHEGPARHLNTVWQAAERGLLELLTSITLADVRDGDVKPPVALPEQV